MKPFQRRYPDKKDLALQDNWSVSQGTYGGKPLIVRVNRGVEQAVGHPEFDHQVGIAVPLHSPDANGFPGPDESGQLDAIEDLLLTSLGAHRQCIFVAAISTGGMREFVFYTSEPEATQKALAELEASGGTHRLQHVIQKDPDWNVYRQLGSSG